ncbi:Glycosyl transferase, group 2 family protein (modular protein) [Desulfamplus magnetovallimortis]|uniref:Glycosyl transferase, group 2 family protein (Modular protein) n=1 Tax=Desulfamplus magnetovallimortis TaxID=1246637 RepID=A0A1W1H7C7_9BACT|nr:TIGR04283 family arsenosugar biosynthesis glycosyltransferase [Desulfamplus magnetovallimortis]SLM28363.1 Glycosyl transferase, group 2 family protein (modular protein) [Desulfamplus magnetovallimortis]
MLFQKIHKNKNFCWNIRKIFHCEPRRQDYLVIFGRYPIPGKTKTRLIPALGSTGAAECHRILTEKTVATVRMFENKYNRQTQFDGQRQSLGIKFYHFGGTSLQYRQWLGEGIDFHQQAFGDLGAKMFSAFSEAFKLGAQRVVLIGTDLPDLSVHHLCEAFDALKQYDIVLGPAQDGGYWLVGMSRPYNLFSNIPWGEDTVFSRTLEVAYKLNLNLFFLETLRDIDRPCDLFLTANKEVEDLKKEPEGLQQETLQKEGFQQDVSQQDVLQQDVSQQDVSQQDVLQQDVLQQDVLQHDVSQQELFQQKSWDKKYAFKKDNIITMGLKCNQNWQKPLISVIIPALNEESRIASAIESAKNINTEIIVVDGGSFDDTVEVAKKCGAKVLTASGGRANQQNRGADVARGKILVFLHADTQLPSDYVVPLFAAFLDKKCVAGAFSFKTSSSHKVMNIVEFGVNLRSRLFKLPYGDQALFFRSSCFRKEDGFPLTPIAEDLIMVQKIKKRGRFAILRESVTTSARRWNRIGILRTTVVNLVIVAGILMGFSPDRFAKLYTR